MAFQNTIFVIFGITGDLSQRKLVPALTHMAHEGYLKNTKILGVSRRDVSARDILEFSHDPKQLEHIIEVVTMDVAEPDHYRKLREKIHAAKAELGAETQVIFYLSVPPHASLPIIENLGEAGMNDSEYKLLLEKPFGVDLASAQDSVQRIGKFFREEQLYRIDHYLAKEMAQNIVAFRSRNAMFRYLWNKEAIERIDIIASEKISIENRVAFYEQTGALRDVLQNHLMQIASLILMDVPADLDMSSVPTHRLKALRSVRSIQSDAFGSEVVRGQYVGYEDEVSNPGSTTETFALVTLNSDDPNWEGVPVRLATGKNLAEQTTEVRIYFRQIHEKESNLLVLHIQPKEGIEIDLLAKKPGYDKDYEKVALSFDYRAQEGRPVEAYERVLLDSLSSDKSLFTSAEEVIESWRILQPVLDHWAFYTDDLKKYQPGTLIDELL